MVKTRPAKRIIQYIQYKQLEHCPRHNKENHISCSEPPLLLRTTRNLFIFKIFKIFTTNRESSKKGSGPNKENYTILLLRTTMELTEITPDIYVFIKKWFRLGRVLDSLCWASFQFPNYVVVWDCRSELFSSLDLKQSSDHLSQGSISI